MIKGTPPTPRDSHSCTNVCDNLFVFGGTDGKSPLKDLHILDTCELLFNKKGGITEWIRIFGLCIYKEYVFAMYTDQN